MSRIVAAARCYGGNGFVDRRDQVDFVAPSPSPSPSRYVVGLVVVSCDSLLSWSVPIRHGMPGCGASFD